MEYQNTDEAVKREACERLKQIVKAIKAIKIKYYLNFSKISAEDRETYQKLEERLGEISETHNLNKLKVALMQEVSEKYDGKPVKDMGTGGQSEPNKILQACYGAIDAQKEALSKGRITQAIRCQEQLKIYMQDLDETGRQEVTNYKREKFAELMQTRQQIEEQHESRNSFTKDCATNGNVEERKKAMDVIQDLLSRDKQETKKTQKEEMTI